MVADGLTYGYENAYYERSKAGGRSSSRSVGRHLLLAYRSDYESSFNKTTVIL